MIATIKFASVQVNQSGVVLAERVPPVFATMQEAIDWLEVHYPELVVETTEDGDGTKHAVCWACEADADNDDGSNAVATVRAVPAAEET